MPRQHGENTKEFSNENEAKRANKHANKRIIYWPPFWNKVYNRLYAYAGCAGVKNSCIVGIILRKLTIFGRFVG